MSHDVGVLKCTYEGCTATVKNHYWGKVRAHADGWFMSSDEKVIRCPEHLPDWVIPWREKKRQEKSS